MLVHRALDQQKEGPSPGVDGVSAKVYKTFESFFVPLMRYTYSYLFGGRLAGANSVNGGANKHSPRQFHGFNHRAKTGDHC